MNDLDELFDRWEQTYPETVRKGFHRDGVIDEGLYRKQTHQILFVLLEPNSRGGAYDKYYGEDLRRVFRIPLRKQVNLNLGLWTRYLLDGVEHFERLGGEQARDQIRRVAIMNLKKLAGSGTADYMSISQHAWQDREFLREELPLIDPTLIVTCGARANRLFGQIVQDDLRASPPGEHTWRCNQTVVLPANHPSLRPKSAEEAFKRLILRRKGDVVPMTSAANRKKSPKRSRVEACDSQKQVPLMTGLTRSEASRSIQERPAGWILRPYPHNRYRLDEFLREKFIAIGWPNLGDLSTYDRESLLARLRETYPNWPGQPYGNWLGTLLRFRDDIHEGDLVVVAPKVSDARTVAIGEVSGPYRYELELDGERQGYPHLRPVRWFVTHLPRQDLPARVAASLTQGTLHRTDSRVLRDFSKSNRWISARLEEAAGET